MTQSQLFQAAIGKDLNGFNKIDGINDETRGLSIYTSTDNSELIIGFTCTKGKIYPPSHDWWKNIMIWPKKSAPGCKSYEAHAGFVDEYNSMRSMIFNRINTFAPRKIHVAGFSQGAAHATLCFRDISYRTPRQSLEAVAFASPRVYTDRGAVEFDLNLVSVAANQRFVRINLAGDPVPHLPPWFLGYAHVGKCKTIGHSLFLDPKVHNGENYIKSLEQHDA